MLNVIKMDLYRLTRSKTLRVGMILAAVISIVAVALSAGFLAIMNIMAETDPSLTEGAAEMALVFPMLAWINGVDLSQIVLFFSGLFSLALIAIITAVFVSEEQSTGYGKNYLGQLADKGYSVVSKLISASVITMVMLLIYTLVSAGASALFFGKYITGLAAGNLALTMLLRLLLYISLNTIIVFLCLLTKSKSASMIVGVIIGVGASKAAYSGITAALTALISRIAKNPDFEFPAIGGFTPDGVEELIVNTGFVTSPDPKLVARAIIVAVAYIAIFAILATVIVRKRDVK